MPSRPKQKRGTRTTKEGRVYAKSLNELAAIFTMTAGTVSKWLHHPQAPEQKPDGWDVEEVRAFILSKSDHAGVRRKLAGETGDDAPDKPRSWKDRRDRAAALKAERELAIVDGKLIQTDVFDRFCATTVPEATTQLRRLLESTLPAKLEGQTAARIRQILRAELDKILKKFESEFQSFKTISREVQSVGDEG
jgi:hypothetical protein